MSGKSLNGAMYVTLPWHVFSSSLHWWGFEKGVNSKVGWKLRSRVGVNINLQSARIKSRSARIYELHVPEAKSRKRNRRSSGIGRRVCGKVLKNIVVFTPSNSHPVGMRKEVKRKKNCRRNYENERRRKQKEKSVSFRFRRNPLIT